jgi:pimeloyl-ACP methyl ester carboxylesterase
MPNGQNMAFAIYTAPDEFDRGNSADDSAQYRPVNLTVTLDNGATSTPVIINLWRPPLLLVHGLWSDPSVWSGSPFLSEAKYQGITWEADYGATNARHFSVNAQNFWKWVTQALLIERHLPGILHGNPKVDIAVTKVDVVAYSMGGILARMYAENEPSTSTPYRRAENYFNGDIHRLITLNTPHAGSPLANLFYSLATSPNPLVQAAAIKGFAALRWPIDQGAIEDLAVGSAALQQIGVVELPSHAIGGTGGTGINFLSLADIKVEALESAYVLAYHLNGGSLHSGLEADPNDGIVGIESQLGGLPSPFETSNGDYDSIHILCTGDQVYTSEIDTLLDEPDIQTFGTFPAVSTLSIASASIRVGVRPKAVGGIENRVSTSLTLNGPAGGLNAAPGEPVLLSITPASGVNPQSIVVVGPGQVIEVSAQPFNVSFPMPKNWSGSYSIQAFGFAADGSVSISNIVMLQVLPAANLTGMVANPSAVMLVASGQTQQIRVTSSYEHNS